MLPCLNVRWVILEKKIMKKSFSQLRVVMVLLLVAFSGSAAMCAATGDMVIVNVVGSEICLPVSLKTSKGTFTIYDSQFVYDGWLQIYGATDANGRKVNVSHASTDHRGGSVIATFNLTWLYGRSDNGDEVYYDDGDEVYYDDGGSQSVGEAAGRGAAEAVGSAITSFFDVADGGIGIDVDGYPYGAISVGMSRFYGEFARFSMKFGGMSGFNMFGGVGKDWVFGLENSDKLAWHVGIGAYISFGGWRDEHNQAVTLNVAIGETPVVVNKAMACEVTYEYFFGDSRRVGVFGGLGFSLGDFEATDPVIGWDFQIGVAVKLWTK